MYYTTGWFLLKGTNSQKSMVKCGMHSKYRKHLAAGVKNTIQVQKAAQNETSSSL
jgi:hypothetical protein